MGRSSSLRINPSRLMRRLEELARIGATGPTAVTRLAFSKEDKAGRDYVAHHMQRLGLDIRIDALGTILGIRKGKTEAPLCLVGSHTDTVGNGGRYDGSLGVLAALEIIEVLNENGIETDRPLGVVSFVNEEGVRFMPDMLGSLYWSGGIKLEEALDQVGTDNTTIKENISQLNYAGNDPLAELEVHSFLELHIEQGPVLEDSGRSIGVVEGVQGLSWWEVEYTGKANHAGTTPIMSRSDAGLAAVRLAAYVRELAIELSPGQRATVGSIRFSPNLINVIPSSAHLSIDLRNPNADRLAEAEKRLQERAERLADEEGLGFHMRQVARVLPVTFPDEVVEAVAASADALGYQSMKLISGAGHDAQLMARVCKAGMVFIPSRNGVSHSPEEYSSPADIEAGANVLLHALLRLAST